MAKKNYLEVWREFVETWKLWKRAVDENFAPLGLDSTSYSILKNLSENGPTTMVRLASLIRVTQGWITGIVDNLEELGFVERQRSLEDRRKINAVLTKKGARTFAKAKEIHLEFLEKCLSGIDDQSIENLFVSFGKLREVINNKPPEILR